MSAAEARLQPAMTAHGRGGGRKSGACCARTGGSAKNLRPRVPRTFLFGSGLIDSEEDRD